MPKQNKTSAQPAAAPAPTRALSPQEGDPVILEGLRYRVEYKAQLDELMVVFVCRNKQPNGDCFLDIRKMAFDRNAKVWRADLSAVVEVF